MKSNQWERMPSTEVPKGTLGKWPDFLVCGFQKAGTSALSINLQQHPDIRIGRSSHKLCDFSQGKEINYFASIPRNTYHLGDEWYKSHFHNDGKVWGECSPSYTTGRVQILSLIHI